MAPRTPAALLAGLVLAAVTARASGDDASGAASPSEDSCALLQAPSRLASETDEDSCTLFSKRGLEFSCDVRPQKDKSDAGTLLLETAARREPGAVALLDLGMSHYVSDMAGRGDDAVVYVVTTALTDFVSHVLPKVNTTFKLVTGDAIKTPVKALGAEGFRQLVDDPRVVRWFAQNCADGEDEHPKVVPVPLGIDYHTLKQKRTRQHWLARASISGGSVGAVSFDMLETGGTTKREQRSCIAARISEATAQGRTREVVSADEANGGSLDPMFVKSLHQGDALAALVHQRQPAVLAAGASTQDRPAREEPEGGGGNGMPAWHYGAHDADSWSAGISCNRLEICPVQ
ncbi:unnamed protein product [Prorocentrum cordatum]|uniref:Uncharacterized protein n=1 Tax=Prorocentrum cordatum TaxID=2364126 RepID=A0ABN9SX30_9DINO|nr:unnamed protein product [Polarella glacialis]